MKKQTIVSGTFLCLVFLILNPGLLHAQTTQRNNITFDNGKKVFDKFNEGTGEVLITEPGTKTFYIHVKKDLKITKVYTLEGTDKKTLTNDVTKPEADETNFNVFKLENAPIIDKKIEVRLCDSGETNCYTLTLSVSEDKAVVTKQNTLPFCDCKVELIPTRVTNTCEERTLETDFGEKWENFDKKKTVYVYDFNKSIDQRGFYKVEYSKKAVYKQRCTINHISKTETEIKSLEEQHAILSDSISKLITRIDELPAELKRLAEEVEAGVKKLSEVNQTEYTAAKDKKTELTKVLTAATQSLANTPISKKEDVTILSKTITAISGSITVETKKIDELLNTPNLSSTVRKLKVAEEQSKTFPTLLEKIRAENTHNESEIQQLKKKQLALETDLPDPSTLLKTRAVNFNKEMLPANRNVQFKVININKFLYDISLTDTLVEFASQPSYLFRQTFLGDSLGLLGNLVGAFGGALKLPSAKTSTVVKQEATGNENLLERCDSNLIRCFIQQYNGLQARVLAALNPCSTFPCCDKVTDGEYHALVNKLADIKLMLADKQAEFNALRKELAPKEKELALCKKTESDTGFYGKTLRRLKALNTNTAQTTVQQKDSIDKIIPNLLSLLIPNVCKKIPRDTLEAQVKRLQEQMKPFSFLNEIFQGMPLETDIKKMVVFLNSMVDMNQTHSLDYINLKGNRLDLQLHIKTKENVLKEFGIPAYNQPPMHIEIPIVHNPFLSFSAGSFICLDSNMQNKRYAWQEVPVNGVVTGTNSQYRLVESEYSLPPMGFSSMVNGTYKFSRNFGIGLSAGVGLTIEQSPTLAYLGGVSIFFGDLRQLCLTYGIAAARVDRLKKNYQTVVDQEILYSSNTTSPEYYKELKVGSFLSLTFTPFKTGRKLSNKK